MRTNRSSPSDYFLKRNYSKIINLEITNILHELTTLSSYSENSVRPFQLGEFCSLDGKWNIINRFIRKTLILLDKLLSYENTYSINNNEVNLIDRIN